MQDSLVMRLHVIRMVIAALPFSWHLSAVAIVQRSHEPPFTSGIVMTDPIDVPAAVPCPDNTRRTEFEPLDQGPARLASIHCLDLPRGQEYQQPPIMSPDGQSIAFWDSGQDNLLDIVSFDFSPGVRRSNRVTFRHFGSVLNYERQDALAWRTDGSALWTVEQQVMRPSGWALSGLTPVLIGRDGTVQRFVSPRSEGAPLDAISWVGGDGRAVAQFGTRGGYHRPEHDDPSPTLAMIDVPRGRILHSVTASDAEALQLRAGSHNGFGLFDVAAVQLGDGRLRALLQLERVADRTVPARRSAQHRFHPAMWLLWTEGQRPVPLTPVFDEHFARAELTPDGSHILAWRALQPDGLITHDCRNCPPDPPPTPVDGTVAALIDAQSGRTIWNLSARATVFWNRFGGPVISPAGTYALIPVPAENDRQIIALLSMTDGRILQRFSLGLRSSHPQSFGFTRGGRQMWIAILNRVAVYDLNLGPAAEYPDGVRP